ncbi:neutral alpha-glucosidase C [Tachyglossus aculeatus]|uniref:neutral alpha-glucosidase C n=1 Tax=Tachyglossus aculeatus TaxID=9261 RepID=UPI0018F56580|nr:neutral alpha-glucosidase C [Tachyglossus aculeatus]
MEPDEEQAGPEEISLLDEAVDKSVFKDCSQIAFYRRQKRSQPGKTLFRGLLDSVTVGKDCTKFPVINEETKVRLQVECSEVEENVFRLKINEESPLKPRFEVPDVLPRSLVTRGLTAHPGNRGHLELASGAWKLCVAAEPFRIDLVTKEETVLSVNSMDRLYFEPLETPPKHRGPSTRREEDLSTSSSQGNEEDLGLWEEKWGPFVDVKANGPSSVGLDFSLPGFEHVYGIPQHAQSLQLPDTSNGEAYRLYNLDVYGYKIHDKLGIYGSVPYLLAHSQTRTVGLFWLNASETLVEINRRAALEVSGGPGPSPSPAKKKAKCHTAVRWMSEGGIIDVFLLMGPTPSAVFQQYGRLTGPPALPPLFSLGYHQCRWNYEDEQDVKAVDAGFDGHDIPYDALWLDIEHTEGKRYFTWDRERFPDPAGMQDLLRGKRRKLVIITDPHIKIDPHYSLYSQAKAKGYFVKNSAGGDFEGICWPGPSCYLDFINPEVRKWYAGQFAFSTYKGSTDILFAWNDMNEPSVFRGPELTMPKDALHHGHREHRELHNIYGLYQQMATAEGLVQRSGGEERPFVLTRSFFAGSQKYGAVWTGDNVAEWSYLKISIPMLLTLSIAGIPFCGADVGGFIGDPDPELLVRWYQAAACQPFFRGHANRETKRREPWLLDPKYTRLIRETIKERYTLLPYWYSLFYRAWKTSLPIMRPLWVEFPTELETFGMEEEYMLGNALLVHPVTKPGATSVNVFLPGPAEVWYDFRTFARWDGAHTLEVPVTLENIPVFQRGGTVVPAKTSVGRSTGWMAQVSYELRVALDSEASATGELYLDDGHSFQYLQQNQFLHRKFSFQSGTLSSSCEDAKGKYHTECVVERILILGVERKPSSVTTGSPGGKAQEVDFTYCAATSLLSLEKLRLDVGADWDVRVR